MRPSSRSAPTPRRYLQAAAGRSRCRSPAAALLSAAVGIIVGLPALRIKGIYLAIATLAFGFIVEEILTRWESVTGGNSGMQVGTIDLFGLASTANALLLPGLALTVRRHAAGAEPAAQPDRARLRRRSAIRRSRRSAWASTWRATRPSSFALSRGAHRHRRRAVRAQGQLHLARAVHLRAVDRAAVTIVISAASASCTARSSAPPS